MGELEEIGRVVGRLGMVFFIHMNILDVLVWVIWIQTGVRRL